MLTTPELWNDQHVIWSYDPALKTEDMDANWTNTATRQQNENTRVTWDRATDMRERERERESLIG